MNAGAGGSAAGGSSIGGWVSSNVALVVSGVVAVSAAAIIAVATLGDAPKDLEKSPVSDKTEQVQEENNSSGEVEKQESSAKEIESDPTASSEVEEQEADKSEQFSATKQDEATNESTSLSTQSSNETKSEQTGTVQSPSQPGGQEVNEGTENDAVTESSVTAAGETNNESSESEADETSAGQATSSSLKSNFAVSVSEESPLQVSLQANDSSADKYIWSFGDGKTEVTTAPVVSHSFASEGTYKVNLKVVRGDSEVGSSRQIEVFGAPKLVLPNVFSPNGDGQNDFFTIDFKESKNIESYTLRVFTLDGEKVFQSHSDQIEWNGELPNGASAPAGKYVVAVEAIATNGDLLKPQPKVITLVRQIYRLYLLTPFGEAYTKPYVLMKRILMLLLVSVAMTQVAGAQSGTIVISSEEYGELKAAGDLQEGVVYVMEENLTDEQIHPEIYDANIQATAGRDASCDCWVEPDDTYTSLNLSDDATSGAIPIPFDFCLYGTDWNSVYINSNGNVTFGSGFITYTPSGFPMGTAMVAPFWADVDPGEGGEIVYKVTEDAIFINYIEVPHYNGTTNLVNTFQVILTDGENEFVGLDRNVSFCYQDMQWTTGDISSPQDDGFGGSAATVGANEGDNSNYIQFGRFNQNNDTYDGPFGADDGIDYLDDQSFTFSACADVSNNIPPVPTGFNSCDTLFVCQGETVEFNTQFLAPENDQNVTITFDDAGVDGFSEVEITDGEIGGFNASFTGSLDNVGTFNVIITATDNGSPAVSTSVIITIVVTEQEIPLFEISGDTTFCGGGSTVLSVPSGFDEYNWSTSCEGDSCEVDQSGTYTVQGLLNNCDATASIEVEEGNFFLPPVQGGNQAICSTDSTLVISANEYSTYSWQVHQDFPGFVYSDPMDTSVYLGPGTYSLTVEAEDGCIGQSIFSVPSKDVFIPNDNVSGLYCDGPQEIEFFGAYTESTSGTLNLYLLNLQEPGWQGGSIDIFIDDELEGNYTLDGSSQSIISIPISYGQYVEIIYNPGNNDEGNVFNFSNCGGGFVFNQPGISLSEISSNILFEGYSGCNADPAIGSWSVTGPEYEITNNDEEDNDFDIMFDAQDYGQYELCFTDSLCGIEYCYDLEISEEPGVELDEEVLVCDEDEFVIEPIESDPAGDATGQWNTGDPEGPLTVTGSDEYCYTLSNQCGQSTSCIDVTMSTTPNPMLSDTLVCGGSGSVTLDPIENDPGYVYSWSGGSADGSTDPQVEVTEPGVYTVTVTSACGSEEAVAEVSIFPGVNPTIATDNTLICDGTSAELELTGSIDGDIEWSTNETSNSILVDQSGEYCVTVSNECESAEDCITITIAEDPSVDILNEDFILCAGDPQTIQTQATGTFGGVYVWTAPFRSEPFPSTGEILDVFSEDIPQDFLGGAIPYTVTVNGPCGSASDEVLVTPAVCNVTIPNIISPNDDNKNEGLYIEGIEYFSSVQLRIFDRWGKLVFNDDSYSNADAWEAEDLDEGVYYYTLVLPTEEFSGYITVVRQCENFFAQD